MLVFTRSYFHSLSEAYLQGCTTEIRCIDSAPEQNTLLKLIFRHSKGESILFVHYVKFVVSTNFHDTLNESKC